MPGTYTNLLYHIVFSTKRREPVIYDSFKERLYEYMGGIVRGKKGKLLAIGGTIDHVHLAVKLEPNEAVSKAVGEIKGKASKWINENPFLEGHFCWRAGYLPGRSNGEGRWGILGERITARRSRNLPRIARDASPNADVQG